MDKWRAFDLPEFEEPSERMIRGVRVTVFPSPHDVPQAFRAYADMRTRQVVIEFKYIDEEPLQVRAKDQMSVWLGRNSHRVYRIGFSSQSLEPSDPDSRTRMIRGVTEALDELESQPLTASASANYELLKNGISIKQDAIFADLARKLSGKVGALAQGHS